MKALEQLFINSIGTNGNHHYQSSKHDLSFIPFENSIYFVLSQDNEKCLYGTVKLASQKLVFDLDKNSSWLDSKDVSDDKAIALLYNSYNFMIPVINRTNKPW